MVENVYWAVYTVYSMGGGSITSLLSWMLWSISCSKNHMTFLRMKVVIKFQWMMLRRQSMLLRHEFNKRQVLLCHQAEMEEEIENRVNK